MDSFPSGHTITTFALAVVLAKGYPSWKIPIYGLACLIGFSRIYLDSHFASDVFAGAVLGVWVGWMVSGRKEMRNY
jgi:undecaprenyl-diphosphatase